MTQSIKIGKDRSTLKGIRIKGAGACEMVAGSKTILSLNEDNHLLDCGTDMQYRPKGVKEPLNFDPKTIKTGSLGHSHLDHMGQFLQAHKEGLDVPWFMTRESADVLKHQLRQQAQSPWIEYRMNKKLGKKGPWNPVLYTTQDVNDILKHIQGENGEMGHRYDTAFKIDPKITEWLLEAGHIFGSAQKLFEIETEHGKVTLLDAVDLGRGDFTKIPNHNRVDTPFLKYPTTKMPRPVDYIIMESTYGDQEHRDINESIGVLEKAIKDTSKQRGQLVIPAFSIQRTSMLMYYIFKLEEEGKLPKDVTIYLNSPGAEEYNKTILKFSEDMDDNSRKLFENKYCNPFKFNQLVKHAKLEDTLNVINDKNRGPSVYIAASGMSNMGRVVPIEEATIGDPKTIVLLCGHQSPGTRGYSFQQGTKEITFGGKKVECKAEIREMHSLSGHADAPELLAHLNAVSQNSGRKPKKIFIKHGEKERCYKLQEYLGKNGYNPSTIEVMKLNQEYFLE